jgi:hypothetical protein
MPATPQLANNSDPNCTYTTYYWQSHPDLWLTNNIVIGDFTYAKSEALELLAQEASDSKAMVLKEFLGAALNILKGADPRDIEMDIASASEWLSAHPPGYEISASEAGLGMELAVKLQAYNNGVLGPGLCPDEPPTPTPTPTNTPTITPTPTRTPIRPTNTPRPTATERVEFQPAPTSPPDSEPSEPPPPEPPPAEPTAEPPKPTSAPTEAPPPPPEPPPPAEPPPPEPPPAVEPAPVETTPP